MPLKLYMGPVSFCSRVKSRNFWKNCSHVGYSLSFLAKVAIITQYKRKTIFLMDMFKIKVGLLVEVCKIAPVTWELKVPLVVLWRWKWNSSWEKSFHFPPILNSSTYFTGNSIPPPFIHYHIYDTLTVGTTTESFLFNGLENEQSLEPNN